MKQNSGISMGILFCLVTVLFTFRTLATSIEVSGEISGQWSVDTVKVTADILLAGDQTLIIEPGVRVEFMGHYRFTVKGTVIALGLKEEIIEVTLSDTSGFSDTLTGAGGWNGICYEHLDPSTDSSLFSYCRFRFGKAITAGDSIGLYGGAFSFVYSSPEIFSNLFEQNSSTGIGGGASFEYSDPLVTHNIFSGNFSGLGGGLGYLRSEPRQVCSNNLDTLPGFSGTGSYPFQVGASSPMKDAGTPDTSNLMVPERDLAGNPRIYNNRLDIGAYEWNPGPGIASNERQGIDVALFPVPAFENFTIRFTLNNAHKVGFSIYRMSGELVYRHTPVDCSTGTNEIC